MSKNNKRQVVTITELITPEWAQHQLDQLAKRLALGTFKQRPLRKAAAFRFSQDMKKGKWILTHQGIAFDEEGNLLDGQTRLTAVVMAGVSVLMRVTRGLPVMSEQAPELSTMDVIDLGTPRNVWQALQVSHGFAGNALEMASAARNIARLVLENPNRPKSTTHGAGMSTAQCLFILEKLGYRGAIERCQTMIPIKGLRPAPVTACWCWYWIANPKKAESFATDYSTLQNLGKGHPALILYRYISTRNLRKRARESQLNSMIANALITYHAGETLTRLTHNDDTYVSFLKFNWPHVEKISDLMASEKAMSEPAT